MSDFEQLWPGGPVFRQAAHFRLGTDSVLLADFVRTDARRRGIDLGCASGALMLLLLARAENLHMTGLELVPAAAELARENMEANGFAERSGIVCGDLREHRTLFPAGSFDLVVANPPYYPAGSGFVSADADRAAARGELSCTLDDVCTAAAYLCRTGGSVCLVHKPERLSELLCTLTARGVEPKRLRLVCPRADSAPGLVLVEGRRGGRPGLTIEPPLLLQQADGTESAEVRRIYHR
jgi:tRNA1Val (adenine37-N6)-methyltransferase